jgi:AcrR family transcriptional regulator
MQKHTAEKFLEVAERLFAQHGFDGVSISKIASALNLTKQALLHHFGSKEKLYGLVLKRISEDYEAHQSEFLRQTNNAYADFIEYFMALREFAHNNTQRTQLLMRELLDNNERAESAGHWYLKPFLHNLINLVKRQTSFSDAKSLALAYQLLGAINYFAISKATLTGIYGAEIYAELRQQDRKQFETLLKISVSQS